jgi:hypothetical protein
MRFACWINKATNKHSEHVILINFHCIDGCTIAPQFKCIRALPLLFFYSAWLRMRMGGIAPLILNSNDVWRWVINIPPHSRFLNAATRLRLDRPWILSRWGWGFPCCPERPRDPSSLFAMSTRSLPGIKRPEFGANQPLPRAGLWMGGYITSTFTLNMEGHVTNDLRLFRNTAPATAFLILRHCQKLRGQLHALIYYQYPSQRMLGDPQYR